MRLLIAIPVFNERHYVARVIDKVLTFHTELLMVDDGSTDGTADYLAQRRDVQLIRHHENRGYGQALIDAFRWADRRGYSWVITMDCDEQHEPESIPQFIRQIEMDQWDIISGSRYLHRESGNDLPPTDRRQINATITKILNERYRLGLTDAFCGFKAHRVCAMRKTHLDVSGYAFPMQLWPQVYHHRLRVKEIPVRLIYKDPTRHFGGVLDDPDERLRHYLDVLVTEHQRIASQPAPHDEPCHSACPD